MQTINPPYWPTLGYIMRWMQAEASISCREWMFMVLLPAVGETIRQEVQQTETPGATPLAPVVTADRPFSAAFFLRIIADWDGVFQGIDQVVTIVFGADGYLDCIKDLKAQNIDPLSYINNLDKVSLYLILKRHT